MKDYIKSVIDANLTENDNLNSYGIGVGGNV